LDHKSANFIRVLIHWALRSSGIEGRGGWWSHPLWQRGSPITWGSLWKQSSEPVAGKLLDFMSFLLAACGLLLSWTECSKPKSHGSLNYQNLFPATEGPTAWRGMRTLKPADRVQGSIHSPPPVQNSTEKIQMIKSSNQWFWP
jgi:hypothetical protein